MFLQILSLIGIFKLALAEEDFFWEMYLIPEFSSGRYGYLTSTNISFSQMDFYDSQGSICQLNSIFDEDNGRLIGLNVTDAYDACPFVEQGWNYTEYSGNIDGSPNSIMGPNG